MVNSSLFNSEGEHSNNNIITTITKTNFIQATTNNSQPINLLSDVNVRSEFNSNLPTDISAIEPIPTKTDENSINHRNNDDSDNKKSNNIKGDNDEKTSLFCSVPLDKVQSILSTFKQENITDNNGVKAIKTTGATTNRKVLCLYCDRSFVNTMLKEKHIERCHSTKQFRRVSSRRHSNNFTCTPCVYCDRLTTTEHTLKELFEHLILNHSNRYFGCLSCEERFLNASHLADHNASIHKINNNHNNKNIINCSNNCKISTTKTDQMCSNLTNSIVDEIPYKITRSRMKASNSITKTATATLKTLENTKDSKKFRNFDELTTTKKRNNLQNKKLVVKTRRNKRLQQTKVNEKKKKLPTTNDKKDNNNKEQNNHQINDKNSKLTTINPYPEFDSFFRVKKITDHSIDNLKISSLTFDDVVFDKAFFNRIRLNIQENLLHYIDGKLFKNEESENRISNFEKILNQDAVERSLTTTTQLSHNIENYGCELTLNAATPTILTTTTTIVDDLESQIEYGSKASNRKNRTSTITTGTTSDATIVGTTLTTTATTTTTTMQIKNNEINYKYFTRRKYQASILEQKENRDLSKLDMWTQYVIKNRQQKILQSRKTQKEIFDYLSSDEYKNQQKRDELNRILDRRGPFEDLREEASKKATLDKLNNDNNESPMINEECFLEVRKLIDNLLDRVSESTTTEEIQFDNNNHRNHIEIEEIIKRPEIPSYLNLRRTSSISSDIEIDKSDRISLICSSQETEDFELPTNQKRDKNEKIELTGEWARSRIYVCAACGLKLQNIKQLLEHKSLYHQYVWVQHYEFVGNQSELYRHLSIPSLGKVGCLEDNVKCKLWKKSDARICTKCNKQCNSLGDLHRHILECGGDWTWMLARKKCRYRPFGTKSRRKRRGLVKRVYPQKSENTEKKTTYKKPFEGPRQKPSDAESIQRMLANLPPKRASRKLIPLKDGFNRNNRSRQQTSGIKSEQQSQQEQKMKCGKIIRRRLSQRKNSENGQNSQKINNKNNDVNKVITSRILDTNKKVLVKRKFNRNLNTDRITRQSKQQITNNTKTDEIKNDNNSDKEIKTKRKSPRNNNNTNKVATFVEKMNIKRFFTIKKNINSSQQKDDTQKNGKRKLENETINISDNDEKNKESFSNLVRTLSLRKKNRKNTKKLLNEEIFNEKQQEKQEPKRKLRSSLKDMVKKICDLKDIQGKNGFLEKLPPETQLSVAPPQQQQTPLSPPTPPPLLSRPSSPPQLMEEKQEEKEIVSTTQDKNPTTNSEKIVIPTVVVTQEIDTNSGDLPIMPAPIVVNYCVTNKQTTPLIGTIFNLQTNNEKILQAKCEEEQFHDKDDKTVTTTITTQASTNIKTNVTTLPKLVSPKGKIKKPTRGLNDCIAMLTNKLNQNSNDSNNIDSIFNLMPYNSNNKDNNNLENNEIKTKSPNRTLLKVPSYPKLNIKTDNFMTVPNIDKEIEQDSESNKTELDIEKKCEEEIVDNIIPNDKVENHLNPHLVCEDETISMENKNLNVDLSQKNESDDELPLALLCEKKEIKKISPDSSTETKINENHEETDRNSVDNLNLITPETSQELEIKTNQEIVENIASSVGDRAEIDNVMDDSGFNSFENRQNEIKVIENEEKENKQNEKNDKIADIVMEENRKQHAKRGRKKKREKTENFLFSFDDEIIHEQNSKNCKKWQEQIIDGDHDSIKMNHEKSLNLPNNTKELSLDSIGEENSEIDLQFNDVIKENNDFIDDTTQTSSTTTRRRSVRSAKTKALEMIIGDALSELTDERNIKNNDFLIEYDHFNDYNCNNKKRKRKRSIEKKNLQLTKDIVDNNEEEKITVEENDKENKKNEKKLSSDELFDLLKSTPCENIVLTKPINSTAFLNNDEISNDFNENHLNTFENILEKTIDVIEENLIDTPPAISMDVFDDNSSDDNVNNDEINKRSIDKDDKTIIKTTKRKRKKRTNKVKSKLLGEEIEIRLENNDNHIELKENNNDNKIIDKSLYCEICDRSFCRAENLMKHKRTLTHISKLSEIEAREAAEKAKLKEQEVQQQQQQQQIDEAIDEINRNSLDISNEPEVEPPLPSENPNLADIISDVLNKPDLNQNNDIDTIIENDEFKPRYRSLGERKSFDSDNSNNIKSIDYYEPEITKNAGTILEKQISLLENIIENRTNLNFDNDISLSNDSKQDSTNIYVQRENDNNFLKPLPQQQYEEISGDDNNQLEQQPQQKLRKALNRDEELFLECCSLLKSSSEASNYSKKSSNLTTVATTTTTTAATTTLTNVLNDLDLKTSEEPDWLENKSLNDIISNMNDEYSDTTRMPTPLGDNFIIDDNSDSNTISSNWQLSNNNNDREWNDKEEQVRSFIFEEISDDEDNNRKEQSEIDDVTKFSEIISKAVRKEYQNVNNQMENRDQLNDNSSVNQSIEDKLWDKSEKIDDNDHKKMLTKGAMKIFEGVKVSIPTEDLNMDQVLLNQDHNDGKKLKKLFKIKRPKNLLKTLKKRTNKMKNPTKKSPDIYDFEETQDNTDLLFTKPDFRSFRNEHIKKTEPILTPITTTTTTAEVNDYSDNDESQSCKNNIFESFSSSTSSISDLPNTIKPKSENLTKKKCMIMGRIFKNAAKSRSDDIIRDIPVIDNTKFVEEFVLNCPEPNKQELQKPSMTDREINLEFDKLINPDMDVKKIEETKQLQQQQQRKKVKTRKRNRANSDSTDDEFSLNNSTRKRNSKRGHKKEDNSINLEQELKECIGVASRKSQRKCTSGKQNVLVEYWSSDESLFETLNKNETITPPITNNTSGVIESKIEEIENVEEPTKKSKDTSNIPELNRRKRTATNPLYHWSSSSEDEVNDLIEVKPIRDDVIDDDYDEDERPVQHGWIVGDSPKKLVTMLAQAKGKKCDSDCVKEQKKKRTFS